MVPHRYDYEPVFIYLKKDGAPHLIVNGGLGSMECNFHKNEIRQREGMRSDDVTTFSEKMSPKPYYPFGMEKLYARVASKNIHWMVMIYNSKKYILFLVYVPALMYSVELDIPYMEIDSIHP
jgi:hypothetical protein